MIFNCFDWIKDSNYPKLHPTQKPVNLLEKLIEIFTYKGDVVIDPVAGSGSTLVAAENIGRKAFGFEIKKNFYMEAKNWIESEQTKRNEISKFGYSKSKLQKSNPILFSDHD